VTNQSGVGRGLLSATDVAAVNNRVEQLLGPFDGWYVCPHGPQDGCACRKPAPGLVLSAAAGLGVSPRRCVVVGDIGSDVDAARAAGAVGVLVPNQATRPVEVAQATDVVRDLAGAADWILARDRMVRPAGAPARPGAHVLAVRADSAGDVLVCGPAIRALAARAARVTLLVGPAGVAAGALLPGVHELLEWSAPWIEARPGAVTSELTGRLVAEVAARGIDEAVIFTSYHQSPLPLALLLRLAGVARISAISDDYPGSLLDVRHRVPVGVPEPERALSLVAAAGYPLPDGDPGGLRVRLPETPSDGILAATADGAIVVHPGATVQARSCPPETCAAIVRSLAKSGHQVLVTGGPKETGLTATVAGEFGTDLGGLTGMPQLARLLAGAAAVVCGNTGPAHLAAAVGTPVVSLFAPTVPFGQWAPYRVPVVRLGDQLAGCQGTRATTCPVDGHPCLSDVDPDDVVAAVDLLTREPQVTREPLSIQEQP
jgi:ADP-heptose:LPS heptosyltransferase